MLNADEKYLEELFYEEKIIEYNQLGLMLCWTKIDGEEIPLKHMEDSHIKNCIKMLSNLRTNYSRKAWIYIFNDVLLKRRHEKLNKLLYK